MRILAASTGQRKMKLRLVPYFLAASFAFAQVGVGLAADTPSAPRIVADETRVFDILVKQKPAGTCTIRIVDTDDGATRVASEVDVKLNVIIYVYHYEFHGQELWRGGRLLASDCLATDNGKKLSAKVKNENGGCVIDANGRARRGPLVDTTTNYWRAPDLSRGGRLIVMNTDQGTVHAVTARQLGRENVTLGEQQVLCTHYRLDGDLQADIWFDGRQRIVRQTSVEDGYPTELVLKQLLATPLRTARR